MMNFYSRKDFVIGFAVSAWQLWRYDGDPITIPEGAGVLLVMTLIASSLSALGGSIYRDLKERNNRNY